MHATVLKAVVSTSPIIHEPPTWPHRTSYLCAEAPAKHVAAIAAAFAKTSSDGALSAIARCPQNDAERAMQKALCKFDLTLDAPVTYVNVGEQCLVPCLKPTDYVRTLNERGYLHRLIGCPIDSSFLC